MNTLDELARTADRFDKWSQVQALVRDKAVETAVRAVRAKFNGARAILGEDPGSPEPPLDRDDLMPIRYFDLGRLAAKPVGRIRIDLGSATGEGYATGFLVAPGILLTNRHVLETAAMARAATVSFDAEDDVRGLPRPVKVFALRPDELFVADDTLDFCCVAVAGTAVDGPARIESYGYLRLFAQAGKITRDEYATIIQHPHGGQKQVAVRNNQIIVYVYDGETDAPGNDFLYYRTDTMHGSSGAPVLSDQFFVVALHRRGVPRTRTVDGKRVVLRPDHTPAREGDPPGLIDYVANEGVRVSRILARLAALASADAHAARALHAIGAAAGSPDEGPFWVPAAPIVRISMADEPDDDALEIVRRKLAVFHDAPGYDPAFLPGFVIGLPKPSAALRAELAPRLDAPAEFVLPFAHFSTAVHAPRRLPVFAAVNLDGREKALAGRMPKRPNWSYDPRLADEHQLDDSIFSSMLQRGHMAARDYVYWGADVAAADVHSFTLSNVCPQIGAFNGNREWAMLERNVIALATAGQLRVSVFAGPVLARRDPLYDSLRGDHSDAIVGSGIRVPVRFWYIVAWVKAQELQVRCFLLDQSDDIDEAGPLEVDLVKPALVKDSTLAQIARLSRLSFPGLKAQDPA
jgi:endonuclease G